MIVKVEKELLTMCAFSVVAHGPLKLGTRALLAEVLGEWPHVEESDEGEELANAVLEWSACQAPAILDLQVETGFGSHCGPSLQRVALVLFEPLL